MNKFSLYSIVTQSEGIIVSDMDGEMWELIKEPIEVKQVFSILFSKYEVLHNDCENQVLSFLEDLYKNQLIQVTHTVDA